MASGCKQLTSLDLGDEGLAALVAPPPPAGTPPLPTGGLKKLEKLYLSYTQITDAGCAALVDTLNSFELPALEELTLHDAPASAAAIDGVREALANSCFAEPCKFVFEQVLE